MRKIKKGQTPKRKSRRDVKPQAHATERSHSKMAWRWARATCGFALGAGGFALGVFNFWGPPWPTAPVVVPGAITTGFALHAPFLVSNESVLFAVRKLSIICSASEITNAVGGGVEGIAIQVHSLNYLAPEQTGPYTCPFNQTLSDQSPIVRARIAFVLKYDSPWPWQSRRVIETDDFILNTSTTPPHWMTGTPLR
jgi:hypothetical protein